VPWQPTSGLWPTGAEPGVTPAGKGRLWGPASPSEAGPLFLLAVLLVACGPGPDSGPDPELEGARAAGLEDGARLRRVILGGRGSEEHVLPLRIRAAPGDGVEFVTVDHRVHLVSFPPDSLFPEGAAFLDSTEQGMSPPLLYRGSRFILRLEGAPSGRYPFVSQGHGGVAHGVIEVDVGSDSLASGPS
jgi:plastocyanin